jgi:hypothetical membrane protein
MPRKVGLWFGLLAGLILLVALFGLGFTVPGYDLVRQTASEIGEAGSPARWPFTAALAAIGLCLLIFAFAVMAVALHRKRGAVGALLIGAMAISVTGVGWFAFPHPLHNTFGESQLIGYLAPLAVAIGWRGNRISSISWTAFAILWVSVVINLGYVGLLGDPLRTEFRSVLEPVYGLVQRSLFVIWFAWCALVAAMLIEDGRRS